MKCALHSCGHNHAETITKRTGMSSQPCSRAHSSSPAICVILLWRKGRWLVLHNTCADARERERKRKASLLWHNTHNLPLWSFSFSRLPTIAQISGRFLKGFPIKLTNPSFLACDSLCVCVFCSYTAANSTLLPSAFSFWPLFSLPSSHSVNHLSLVALFILYLLLIIILFSSNSLCSLVSCAKGLETQPGNWIVIKI